MYYKSTRNSDVRVDSATAITQGISADGGLFVPESVPKLTLDEMKYLVRFELLMQSGLYI